MIGPVLALALAATPVAPASPLEAPPPPRARTPGVGRVLQATRARVYLDAGADDGLAVGDVLLLRRGDDGVGRCTVDAVAPGSATCTGLGARPGDVFALGAPPAPARKVVTLPPLLAEAELERRAAALSLAPVALVEYRGPPKGTAPLAAARAGTAEVSLDGTVWTSSGSESWELVAADVLVSGAALGPFTVDLDLRAERWLSRGAATFRPEDDSRLYVWQAQLGWARPGGSLSVAAGRILPWSAPGATVMDGALVGVRRGRWRAGLFGGLVPEPDTLYPTPERATAGGQWSFDRRFSRDVALRHEGRVAWVRSPELGDRGELEGAASLHAGRALDLGGSARLAAGGTVRPAGALDAARLEILLRPLDRLSVRGGLDYGGVAVPVLVTPPAFGTRGRHADLSAFYELGPVRLGASGGTARDDVSGLERRWVGPEAQVPRFFSPRVSLSAGWLQETGWLEGRGAWLQALARPWDALRLSGRASWHHESSLAVARDEVGVAISGAAELTRHLGLGFSLLARAGLDAEGERSDVPIALVGSATLSATY